jgi:hypothetical protein
MVNNRRLQHMTCLDTDFHLVNFVTLEFTNKKNGVKGELVGLGRSGHPAWCPVLDPSAQVVPWLNFVPKLIQMLYAYWGDGAATKCCATSMFNPFLFLPHYLQRCFTMAPLHSCPASQWSKRGIAEQCTIA